MARALALLPLALLAGCGGAYRYRSLERQDFVVPPGVRMAAPGQAVERMLGKVDVRCAVETPSLSVRVRGGRGTARLAGTDAEAAGRGPQAVAEDYQKVRDRLGGCPGGEPLLARLADTLPMASRLQHQLQYGFLTGTGILELKPPLALRYVAPAGTGVTMARYGVRPDGSLERRAGPATPVDAFVAGWSHFRLLFLTHFSSADHKEILVRSRSREGMAGGTAACREDAERPDCLQLDRGAAIAAEIPLTVDGVLKFVPVDASAGEAAGRRPIRTIRRGPRRLPVRWEAGTNPNRLALLGGEILETQGARP